jgi:tetratricopeptide (TPR) repeat protein
MLDTSVNQPKDLPLTFFFANTAISLDPKFTTAFKNRSEANLAKGDAQKAVDDASASIKLNPKDGQAYQLRSRAHAKLGKADLAKADQEMAVKLNPAIK